MAGTRTTTTGTPPDFRYTSGQPDGLNVPAGGFNPGQPPFVWITGGSIAANSNPSGIGATRILDALTDSARGYSIAQCNAPAGIGNDTSRDRINDAVTWGRANLGWTNDPPILLGISNGWACDIIYARRYPVTGVVGILTVTDARDCYVEDTFGLRATIEAAWGVTYPTEPPLRFSPYNDVTNYPLSSLRGRIQMWYCAGDFLFGSEQMAFGAQMQIDMRNVGAYGHLGTFTVPSLSVDHVDTAAMVAFVDSLWTP